MIEYTGQTRANYHFFISAELRISDVDINNHLNQSVYYEFFDTAVLRYLAQCGVFHNAENNITSFCVENGCRYRREILFSDTVEVALRVARIGTTSVQFDLAVFTANHHDPNTIAYFVLVFTDKTTRRPIPIPKRLREQLVRDQ